MITVIFMIVIAFYMFIRFMKKKRDAKGDDTEILTFEDQFEKIYGTSWDSWVAVKRDLVDTDGLLSAMTDVFSDMYLVKQYNERGAKK
ncbi:MAG: hypothetical protein HDR03_14900 [Lachnospiraceae bacterium]|nr:hypothetical protein [Lachnospiraceae bacterium]